MADVAVSGGGDAGGSADAAEPSPDGAGEQEAGAEGGQAAHEQAQAAEAARIRLKFKVHGRETEGEYTHEELAKLASNQKASARAWNEADKIRKDAESRLKEQEEALKDPRIFKEWLKKNGHDFTKLAEQHILEQMEQEALSPEEKMKAEFATREAALKAERDAFLQEQDEAETTALMRRIAPIIEKHLPATVKELGMPHTAPVLEAIDKYLTEGLNRGIPVTTETIRAAGEAVKEEFVENLGALTDNMDADQIYKMLGPVRGEALANKFRKRDANLMAKRRAENGGLPVAAPVIRPTAPKQNGVKQDVPFNKFHSPHETNELLEKLRQQAAGRK